MFKGKLWLLFCEYVVRREKQEIRQPNIRMNTSSVHQQINRCHDVGQPCMEQHTATKRRKALTRDNVDVP